MPSVKALRVKPCVRSWLGAKWYNRGIHRFGFAAPCTLSRKGRIFADIQPVNDAALERQALCRSRGHAVLMHRNGGTLLESLPPIFGGPIRGGRL
jgi:hypothetical protein